MLSQPDRVKYNCATRNLYPWALAYHPTPHSFQFSEEDPPCQS
jgi:hypothetical protein